MNQNGEWTGYGSLTWPYVNVAPPVYGMDGSKLSAKVAYAERGKPVYPPSFWQVKPQGTLLGMEVQESGGSEGHSVMGWIRVERQNFDITRPEREPNSRWCLIVRESEEPYLWKCANDGGRKTYWCYSSLGQLLEIHRLEEGKGRSVKASDAYCEGSEGD